MSTAPISMNPTAQQTQAVNPRKQITTKANEAANVAPRQPATDKVTISKQAILMNSKTYSPAEESQESAADKAYEKKLGQR